MSDPVGVQEIAERCGAPASTVSQWVYRLHPKNPDRDFPAPDYTVGGRGAWEWATVESWLMKTGRAPGPVGQVIIDVVGLPCVELGCDAIGLPDGMGGVVWAQTRATAGGHDHQATP
ncbi:MAG: hypothetical protein JWN67_5022 [Actinomycetia bacterium]|nr:hypothetical protein [Actinomycetes bacterium]